MIEPDWLTSFREWLQTDWPGKVKDYIVLPLLGLILAMGAEFLRKRYHLFENKRIQRGPEDVPAESLTKRKRVRNASGPELIKAINWGALDLVAHANNRPDLPDISPIEAAWSRTSFEKYAKVAASFITPRCTVAAVGGRWPMEKGDALAVLKEWLRGPPTDLRGEIRGDTGVGKTMLLHQLFVDLVKSNSKAVPILASADNINQNSDELERLKHDSNHIRAFVSVWLKKRRVVAKTEADQKAMVNAVSTALDRGDIVLLLDGVDELRAKGAEEFADGLLLGARRSIVTRRYEASARQDATGHVITLESAWSGERILEYTGRHLAARPELAARVKLVVAQQIPVEATSSYWLSHPSNLRAYLDEVVRSGELATEAEMHRLAESATGLMDQLVSRDMRGIENANPIEIRDALSVLALCRPGDSRAWRDGPLGKKVAGMKTLLRSEGRSLVFRHSAEAEYFLAVRLARELLDGPSNWADAEALQTVAGKPWGTARVRLVDESLRNMSVAPARAANVARWLRGSTPVGFDFSSTLAGYGKRNLLEVWKKTRSVGVANTTPGTIQDMNLNGMDGQGLDLRNERIESCTFVHADLRDAEMMHAQFIECQFAEADLRGANAIGADFERCSFGDDNHFAKVEGLEIEGIQITPPELELKLTSGQARSQRSRYRGKFGQQFLKAQRAFLGRAVADLETDTYVPAIRSAIRQALARRPDDRVYLMDLMAGGHGGRSEELLAEFPQLHILSIDRDAAQRPLSDRHQWMNLEFGAKPLAEPLESDPFALGALLRDGFDESGGKADVVIAKKALHELERRLQPALIQSCAAVLRPEGHLVLFVDAPGAETGPVDPSAREAAVRRHEQLREMLLKPTTRPHEVKSFVSARRYEEDPNGEWLFANDWIAVKDWANLNNHELAHRYFASVAELRQWASPWFGEPVSVKIDRYEINPLRFNERGINWILHYLERNKDDPKTAIAQHRAMLAERYAGSEAFRALVDITRAVLGKPSGFARMMNAESGPVRLAEIEPLLAPLETMERAPQFELKCGVIEFERRS